MLNNITALRLFSAQMRIGADMDGTIFVGNPSADGIRLAFQYFIILIRITMRDTADDTTSRIDNINRIIAEFVIYNNIHTHIYNIIIFTEYVSFW